MEELKNEEVLTEEIQEETTEIFEPDVDDIIPTEEAESKGSNEVVLFTAGALVAVAVFGAVKLTKKIKRKWKAKKGSEEFFEWEDQANKIFEPEEDDEVETD